MKKNKIFILLFALLVLTSCKPNANILDQVNISESIVRPEEEASPIEGTYKLTDINALVQSSEELENKYKNMDEIYISKDLVQIEDRFTISPNFKSRYMNFLDYTRVKLNDMKLDVSTLDMKGTILTVSDGQYFYQDIYLINENNIAFLYDGVLFSFKKVSEGVPKEVIDKARDLVVKKEDSANEDNKLEYPSILLGVSQPRSDSNNKLTYSYKTYLIEVRDDSFINIETVDDIIYPRDQGFWRIGVEHKMVGESSDDLLYAYPIAGGEQSGQKFPLGNMKNFSLSYIGKDYIAIESTGYDSSNKSYGIYNFANIETNKKSNILDIAGEDGLKVMQDEIVKSMSDKVDTKSIEDFYDPENIGLRRNNGKWEFKTNITQKKENGETTIKDVRLPINPIVDIFNNNNLSIAWENIKNKVPGAIDAYTSVDDRMLLVQNQSEILIYEIKDGVISNKYLGSIKFEKDDRIISCVFSSPKSNKLWKNTILSQKPTTRIITEE